MELCQNHPVGPQESKNKKDPADPTQEHFFANFANKFFQKSVFWGGKVRKLIKFLICSIGGLFPPFWAHMNDNNPLEVIELCQNRPLGPPESKKNKKDVAHFTRKYFFNNFDIFFRKLVFFW